MFGLPDYLIKTTCSSTLKLLPYNNIYQGTDGSLNHTVKQHPTIKPLPLTRAQTSIRPTNWPFSHSLYSKYELCNCNTFSVYAGVLQRHFYIEQIHLETAVLKYQTNADHETLAHLPTSHTPITSALPTTAAAGWCINTELNMSACHQGIVSSPHRVTHSINRHSFLLP
jgi:hypothetical protein